MSDITLVLGELRAEHASKQSVLRALGASNLFRIASQSFGYFLVLFEACYTRVISRG